MKSLTAYASEQEPLGFFRIYATPPGGYQREITLFRGAPVQIGAVTTQDPFTEATAGLSFPMITVFDTPGEGDLDWLVPDCDIDIVWQNVGGYDFNWRWEGYIASYSFSLTGAASSFSIDLKGAFYGLDDYLAIPAHPKRPIPYEILIAQAFDQAEHPAHLGKFQILFPADWDLTVPQFDDPRYLSALKPWGIATGQPWTGFTSRSTGSWEPLLTGHIQSLLTVMFAEGGSQWSIRNRGQRRPELFLRRQPEPQDDDVIEIVLGAPGVTLDGSRDYTQRAGVIYGSGVDETQKAFSNIQVTPDGRNTYYKPFAYSPRLWPRGKTNSRYDAKLKPKETMLRFQDGVDELSAMKIAQGQYQRFSEPGVIGTITLTTDPRTSSGELMPRLMIRGGQSIRILGLLGVREGVLAHITQASADFTGLTTSLTFDTKYRDQLTVEEVRARTRDALTPMRALQVGKYSNTIQDLVLPWSYQAGSGIIPTPAKAFFSKLPENAVFPFEEWTKAHPPKDPSSQAWYIEIGKTDPDNSNNNWSAVKRDGKAIYSVPIRMSQAGAIRLTQLAAYDKHGNVLPVKFHLSIYDHNGIAADSMPQLPGPRRIPGPASDWVEGNPPQNPKGQHTYKQASPPGLGASPPPEEFDLWLDTNDNDKKHWYNVVLIDNEEFPKYLKARKVNGDVIPTTYGTKEIDGQMRNMTHPFYEGAWESVQPNGVAFPWDGDPQLPAQGFIVGWGNYYEPAGYSPGRFSKGAARTGLLEDSTPWSFDLTTSSNIDLNNPRANLREEYVGMAFVEIYCDDQDDQSVYFMGRLIRNEPGQS